MSTIDDPVLGDGRVLWGGNYRPLRSLDGDEARDLILRDLEGEVVYRDRNLQYTQIRSEEYNVAGTIVYNVDDETGPPRWWVAHDGQHPEEELSEHRDRVRELRSS